MPRIYTPLKKLKALENGGECGPVSSMALALKTLDRKIEKTRFDTQGAIPAVKVAKIKNHDKARKYMHVSMAKFRRMPRQSSFAWGRPFPPEKPFSISDDWNPSLRDLDINRKENKALMYTFFSCGIFLKYILLSAALVVILWTS